MEATHPPSRSGISSSSDEEPHQSSLQQPSFGSFWTAISTPKLRWVDSRNCASGETGTVHGVSEAVKAEQSSGMGLEEVLDFSRHRNVTTLMVYRDQERNSLGQLAGMVAGGV